MTVKQLIEEFNKIENKDLQVLTEGCDCLGDVYSIRIEDKTVTLTRSETIYIPDPEIEERNQEYREKELKRQQTIVKAEPIKGEK